MFIPLGDDVPRTRLPRVTFGLVALNVAIYVIQRLISVEDNTRLLYAAGAVPWEVARFSDLVDTAVHVPALLPPPLTILSSIFLHGGIEHLVGNVWFLWMFGRTVEGRLGAPRFLGFYLAMGVLGAACQVAMTPGSQVPMIGASGAIAGVLGAYLVLFPRRRVQLLVFLVVVVEIVTVPAYYALGTWFLWQVISWRADASLATQVAVWAHLGGFLLGAVLCKLFAQKGTVESQWIPVAAVSSSSPL